MDKPINVTYGLAGIDPPPRKYHLRYIPPSTDFLNRLSRFLLRRLFLEELFTTMDWTDESIDEQMAYFFLTIQDSEKVGELIFDYMNEASKGTQRDITETQAFFLKVTKIMSEIDKEYSLLGIGFLNKDLSNLNPKLVLNAK